MCFNISPPSLNLSVYVSWGDADKVQRRSEETFISYNKSTFSKVSLYRFHYPFVFIVVFGLFGGGGELKELKECVMGKHLRSPAIQEDFFELSLMFYMNTSMSFFGIIQK